MLVEKISQHLKKIYRNLLFGTFLLLPISLYFNNLFLLLFIITFGLSKLIDKTFFTINLNTRNLRTLFILSGPFILSLIGLFYANSFSEAIKGFERVIPIFFIVYYIFLDGEFFKKNFNKIWISFAAGTILAALICWSSILIDIFSNQKSLKLIFSQEYSNHNLTAALDIHTPYLALFVNAAIGYLVLSLNNLNELSYKTIKIVSILILSLFLFNLMSRNAIFCYIIFMSIYLGKSQRKYLLFLFYLILIILIAFIFNTDKNYYRDRFVKSVNIFETETIFSKKDDRFSRWGASINVFKSNPVFGPGPVEVKELRKQEYIKNLDSIAYNHNYNAHNQFIEYLSTYGLIGASLFIVLIFKLFNMAYNKRSYLLIFLVSCLVISSLTESILNRSWGISFYILIIISLAGVTNHKKWVLINESK